ncbi:metallophosphoesterase family protein [Hydrogenobacter hydrogenophilus]|uniref:Nuclease SbcCD subunit D n=1 Tax=Hydrogenobacter hydrogenophilus TaxID=35835 RepID=A0A285P2P8_9AQUI|nr:exonuclease subunit SbcD [Hydrogenobacter hydrogenophilus]SNZ15718.1 Exodeoxyribonuclease I subunit D [Hydrogenobacter hydrogenophilus]
MRLLHISDLHAGKSLGRINRNEDLEYALSQVINICKEEKVDVLLIAGDIYDKANPDHESQDMMLDFLTKLHTEGVHTVLIAGNHDSYDLIRSYKHLRRIAHLHVIDRPCKDPKDCILKFGDLTVACLPYPSERLLTHLHENPHRSYTEKVANYLKVLAKHVESARYKVLLAHLMVESAKISGTERQSTVGEFYALKLEHIPECFDYIALGHVHRHQRINRAYYSGSLYQIDFSEKGMEKFANLVILEDELQVKPIKLDIKRELHEIKVGPRENFSEVLERLRGMRGIFKVILTADMRDMSINVKKKQIEEILGDNLVRFEIQPLNQDNGERTYEPQKVDLISAYMDYYEKFLRQKPSKELMEEFIKLLQRAEYETHTA